MCFSRPGLVYRLKTGGNWFDDAVMKVGIKNFRWPDLRHTFAGRLRMHDISVRTNRMQWYPCLEQVTPEKTVSQVLPCKFLCNKEFRGVAQW